MRFFEYFVNFCPVQGCKLRDLILKVVVVASVHDLFVPQRVRDVVIDVLKVRFIIMAIQLNCHRSGCETCLVDEFVKQVLIFSKLCDSYFPVESRHFVGRLRQYKPKALISETCACCFSAFSDGDRAWFGELDSDHTDQRFTASEAETGHDGGGATIAGEREGDVVDALEGRPPVLHA
jgi:hypothetical protein